METCPRCGFNCRVLCVNNGVISYICMKCNTIIKKKQ